MKTHKVVYLCTVLFRSLASAALFLLDPFFPAPASLLFSCHVILVFIAERNVLYSSFKVLSIPLSTVIAFLPIFLHFCRGHNVTLLSADLTLDTFLYPWMSRLVLVWVDDCCSDTRVSLWCTALSFAHKHRADMAII